MSVDSYLIPHKKLVGDDDNVGVGLDGECNSNDDDSQASISSAEEGHNNDDVLMGRLTSQLQIKTNPYNL